MRNSPLLPDGQTSFDLSLGKLRVRIVNLPTPWEPFVARYYHPFAETPGDGPRPHLTIVCRTDSGIVVPLPGPGKTPVIRLEREREGRFRIRSHWQDGWVDLSTGEGELTLTDRHEIEMHMSVQNFLRVACQLSLPRWRCFLLHSAGVLEDDRCYLFFGHSGAGKTTATALSAPRRALSDDMVLIDASEPSVRARAVPFFGHFPLQERMRGAFPVAGAFRLRQATRDELESVSVARATATVSASVPFVEDLGLHRADLTDLVTEVCRQIPVYDLHFTRSDRFWEIIHRELSGKA